MAWSSISPNGTLSVKANNAPMAANTVYIETELNKDHFWNIGANEDGRHQFAQMPAFETGGLPDDPVRPAGLRALQVPAGRGDLQVGG